MKNSKIRVDRPDISDEQALQHKNFDSVLEQAQALEQGNAGDSGSSGNSGGSTGSGFSKFKIWGGGALVVATIAGGIYFFGGTTNNTTTTDNTANNNIVAVENDEHSHIQPPIEGANVPYQFFNVSAGSAENLEAESGTNIEIAETSFVDENGQPVTGDVEIRYREFHDPADFFLSGIPMTYDSAGHEFTFESAGMLEILAYQDGNPVFINPDAPITVDMVSHQVGNHFNLYQFDDKTGQWTFLSKDTTDGTDNLYTDVDKLLAENNSDMKKVEKILVNNLATAQKEIGKINKKLPQAPQKASKGRFNINIDYNKKEFPELESYKGVLFEITPENTDFDPALANVEWEYVSVKKQKKNIILTFTKGRDKRSFITEPVFEGKNYDEAVALFEQRNKDYLTLLEQRKEDEVKAQKQLEYLALTMNKDRESQDQVAAMMRAARIANKGTEATVRRTFQIKGFGVYNSDCPLSMPQGRILAMKFQNEAEQPIEMSSVYIVDMQMNSMFKLNGGANDQLRYNPESETVLWGLTPSKELAYFTVEDFEDLEETAPRDSAMFTMRMHDKQITRASEVRKLLGLGS